MKKFDLKNQIRKDYLLSTASLDDSKCKKGHSYQVIKETNSNGLIEKTWACKKCGREL
jgi:hypothetical protein